MSIDEMKLRVDKIFDALVANKLAQVTVKTIRRVGPDKVILKFTERLDPVEAVYKSRIEAYEVFLVKAVRHLAARQGLYFVVSDLPRRGGIASFTFKERPETGVLCRYCYGSGIVLDYEEKRALDCQPCQGSGSYFPSAVVMNDHGACSVCGDPAIGATAYNSPLCAVHYESYRTTITAAQALANRIDSEGADSLPADVLIPYESLMSEDELESAIIDFGNDYKTVSLLWRGFLVLNVRQVKLQNGIRIHLYLIDAGDSLPAGWVAVNEFDRVVPVKVAMKIKISEYGPDQNDRRRHGSIPLRGTIITNIDGAYPIFETRITIRASGESAVTTVGTGMQTNHAKQYASLILFAAQYIERVAAKLGIKLDEVGNEG